MYDSKLPKNVYDPHHLPRSERITSDARGIPEPEADVPSLQGTVEALKELVETLVGLRDNPHGSIDEIVAETFRVHGAISRPFKQNPHYQYWHKILDPSWAHMYFENFASPKSVTSGSVITGWTGNFIGDYHLNSDTTNGTVVVDSEALGTYQMSINGFCSGTSGTDYLITLYADGVLTPIHCPIVIKTSSDGVSFGWNGVIHTDAATLDLRVSGGTLSLYSINWSAHRISPIAGSTGISGATAVPRDTSAFGAGFDKGFE